MPACVGMTGMGLERFWLEIIHPIPVIARPTLSLGLSGQPILFNRRNWVARMKRAMTNLRVIQLKPNQL